MKLIGHVRQGDGRPKLVAVHTESFLGFSSVFYLVYPLSSAFICGQCFFSILASKFFLRTYRGPAHEPAVRPVLVVEPALGIRPDLANCNTNLLFPAL